MTHKELVDQISANLFKQSRKIESQKSWLAMRNYLEQLDSEQLKLILDEAHWKKNFLRLLRITTKEDMGYHLKSRNNIHIIILIYKGH